MLKALLKLLSEGGTDEAGCQQGFLSCFHYLERPWLVTGSHLRAGQELWARSPPALASGGGGVGAMGHTINGTLPLAHSHTLLTLLKTRAGALTKGSLLQEIMERAPQHTPPAGEVERNLASGVMVDRWGHTLISESKQHDHNT